jgi:hypothetical protein
LVGWGGIAPLHLAARSIEVEEDTKKASQGIIPSDQVSDAEFEFGKIFRCFFKIAGFDIAVPTKSYKHRT